MDKATDKMKAPRNAATATIDGHPYVVPKDGIITLAVEAHRSTLQSLGFVDYHEALTAADIKEMDKEDLIEFIESFGGEVDSDDKPKALRLQAMTYIK